MDLRPLCLLVPLVAGCALGRSSVYYPKDGFNSGRLACGGQLKAGDCHVALRSWRRLGCNRPILLVSLETFRIAVAPVRDAGPFGIFKPPLRKAVREGRWRVFTGSRPPKGWYWRGHVDMTRCVWKRLGRPQFLSRVMIWPLPESYYFIQKLLARIVSRATAFAATLIHTVLRSRLS